ncbi:MAG: hypothetical protein ABIV21_07935, partial [Pyrinomonadaceae bacterium]
ARRVIKPDGTLLLSIPYYSPMRRLLTPFRGTEWRTLKHAEVDGKVIFEGLTYFQYAYTIPEFKSILASSNLKCIETMGYSVMWGLYDLKFLNDRARKKNLVQSDESKGTTAGPTAGGSGSSIKSLLIGEDRSTAFKAATTDLMRWSAANMMMFVCKKAEQ